MSFSKKECPHCRCLVPIEGLSKIPYSGHLRWYEFTPRPKFACPKCGGIVVQSVWNSALLVVAVAPPLATLALSLFVPESRFLLHGIWAAAWALPAFLTIVIATWRNRLLPSSKNAP
jgi:hypothetical protein